MQVALVVGRHDIFQRIDCVRVLIGSNFDCKFTAV